MSDKEKARKLVKANDAVRKAKNKEREDGTPVPKKLKDDLSKAVKDWMPKK